ncbi:glycoside hydrolase family 32 protein [Halalkalibacter hemicellulosilyticus]|uniref:Sucrose-6-phosphate hydrolase n=1 Tax=Halalkalibacter hemicellulosilyticusJCM 9152 TaxID=1236971 RepID=W4QC43_9BACI|nr:sucrose-6-phosphate hydrolase [Halalkalibacter hemicellulosilyticus]GAE29631.1 sucrose-6-phosphate hydrolase [Halalkalibacter hemicellulosilyticusJCM 9152]
MTNDQKLRVQVTEEIDKHKGIVEKDPHRLHYHLMPPVGLLNDPNGFIQWRGTYHLFYQWMPFKTDHGAKFWGHYTSKDLVNWQHEEVALTPAEWFEKNGCYSGSAIEHEGKLYLFYTGNVKNEHGKRESYQCLATSHDGSHFKKHGPVTTLPDGFTAHFRDPKVWQQGDRYFMVIGAQTETLKGAIVLFQSDDLIDWKWVRMLTGGDSGALADFGYMFECPDLFHLDGKDVLVFSPQGLKPDGMKYHNVYQAGYTVGVFDPTTGMYEHDEFTELDRGFDFYAPQTTVDDQGRRLLFAWMSVPDQDEQMHPTITYKWLHTMTLPRELQINGDKLYQVPVKELEDLRKGDAVVEEVLLANTIKQAERAYGQAFELLIEKMELDEGWFEMTIRHAVRIVYSSEQRVLTLERKSYVDGVIEKRQCELDHLSNLRLFVDTSSIELFINDGAEVFTARFYPSPNDDQMVFGSSSTCRFWVKRWELDKVF